MILDPVARMTTTVIRALKSGLSDFGLLSLNTCKATVEAVLPDGRSIGVEAFGGGDGTITIELPRPAGQGWVAIADEAGRIVLVVRPSDQRPSQRIVLDAPKTVQLRRHRYDDAHKTPMRDTDHAA